MIAFASRNSSAAQPKPTRGEMSRTLNTLVACSQSTPDVPLRGIHQLVGDANPDDRADHGVRT